MSCSSCGLELPAGVGFCHHCGAQQRPAGCQSCGSGLLAGAAFCSVCGSATSTAPAAPPRAEAERRLTSVLFADLVGHTTYAEGHDPEDVRELLSAYIETLDRSRVTVWRAHAEEDLGRWLIDQGRVQEGAVALRAARETYEAMGAATWTARVREAEGVALR